MGGRKKKGRKNGPWASVSVGKKEEGEKGKDR